MQGITVKIPGPFAPPCLNRPKRKMTALSYSATTWKQNKGLIRRQTYGQLASTPADAGTIGPLN